MKSTFSWLKQYLAIFELDAYQQFSFALAVNWNISLTEKNCTSMSK